eukprot:scaffold308139_cov18-Tisochrysis_lutea.AAC.1
MREVEGLERPQAAYHLQQASVIDSCGSAPLASAQAEVLQAGYTTQGMQAVRADVLQQEMH